MNIGGEGGVVQKEKKNFFRRVVAKKKFCPRGLRKRKSCSVDLTLKNYFLRFSCKTILLKKKKEFFGQFWQKNPHHAPPPRMINGRPLTSLEEIKSLFFRLLVEWTHSLPPASALKVLKSVPLSVCP